MKTIEERAKEYGRSTCDKGCLAYFNGCEENCAKNQLIVKAYEKGATDEMYFNSIEIE